MAGLMTKAALRGENYKPNGYPVMEWNGRQIGCHVVAAFIAMGREFDNRKHPVHHVDETKWNFANNNLVICEDRKYHALLHRRMDVLQAGGDPRPSGIVNVEP